MHFAIWKDSVLENISYFASITAFQIAKIRGSVFGKSVLISYHSDLKE